MPTMTAAERRAFVRATEPYADSRVKSADKNGNGNLTRAEAESLGDVKDTYDLYAQPGRTVKTDKFLEFYKAYARVSARQPGELPTDLKDNAVNWLALRSAPSSPSGLGQVVDSVLADMGLSRMRVDIDMAELEAQVSGLNNTVGFEAALRDALDSFLTDGDDIESPLGLVTELNYGAGLTRDELLGKVRELLNSPSTTLRVNARTNPPEHGESVEDNWVIRLSVPDLGDHGHWAIVDRAGNRPTYNYGFN